MIHVNDRISIDEHELVWEFVRASGPGGQNVNKVATAVKLRFDVTRSSSLPQDIRKRLISLAGRKVNRQGVLIIDARRFRTQERNRKDAVDRLAGLIRRAAQRPKRRVKTRASAASKRRRLEEKKRRSETKSMRRAVPFTSK